MHTLFNIYIQYAYSTLFKIYIQYAYSIQYLYTVCILYSIQDLYTVCILYSILLYALCRIWLRFREDITIKSSNFLLRGFMFPPSTFYCLITSKKAIRVHNKNCSDSLVSYKSQSLQNLRNLHNNIFWFMYLKGVVSRDFRPLFSFMNRTHLGP